MNTPLSNRRPGHHPSLSGTKGKGPDRKKLLLIGVSIGLFIVILIALAAIAITALEQRPRRRDARAERHAGAFGCSHSDAGPDCDTAAFANHRSGLQ